MTQSPPDRIEAALARIEAAVRARTREASALQNRHEALKAEVGEAIAALDDILGKGSAA